MHEMSRETLIRDMEALLGVGRDDMDTLVITPRQTSNGLLVMMRDGTLQLVYPQTGWLDVVRVSRFWLCALKHRLSPQFESWGKVKVHRVSLGSDATRAATWIDDFFAVVFRISGPFALNFLRQGWGPPSPTGAA